MNAETASDIVAHLRYACDQTGSQRQWCQRHEISECTVSLVLSGAIDATEAVANALGYVRRYGFYKITRREVAV